MMPTGVPEYFAVAALALFSLSDLRTRLAPGIELFFFAALLIAAPDDPLHAALVVAALARGLLRSAPGWLALPLLLHPPVWPLLLVGSGTRQGLLGRADLLAAAGLTCLFPWPALVLALARLEAWRRFWVPRQDGPVPALPGLLLGILAYLGLRLAFSPA
jgi:hypothetical protein